MSLYFDNNKLFDAEGHLTDEGLYAIKDGTLDDLGALEAAEHLSFCDYCLLRYTAMIDAAPDCMKQPRQNRNLQQQGDDYVVSLHGRKGVRSCDCFFLQVKDMKSRRT